MRWCGESRIMSYYADTVCFVVSWGACEGFSSGACLSDCRIFLMWHVQAIQSLSLLKDRHPCLVLESVYLLIRGSGSSHLRVKLFPKDYFQHCFSSALFPPCYICSTENLFHLIMGCMYCLHGCCLFHFIPKTKRSSAVSDRDPSLQHQTDTHADLCAEPCNKWTLGPLPAVLAAGSDCLFWFGAGRIILRLFCLCSLYWGGVSGLCCWF